MSPEAAQALDIVADAYDPLLTLLALLLPVLKSERSRIRYYAAAALGIAFVYLLMAIDRAVHPRTLYGYGYSTHTAFAASLLVSLAAWKPRWRLGLAISFVLYVVLELVMQYHTLPDILLSAVLAGGATWGLHRLFLQRLQPN